MLQEDPHWSMSHFCLEGPGNSRLLGVWQFRSSCEPLSVLYKLEYLDLEMLQRAVGGSRSSSPAP